jgi:MFS family permease
VAVGFFRSFYQQNSNTLLQGRNRGMEMKFPPRNVLLLSVAFFLIFCGFDGAQQYVTVLLEEMGIGETGFLSLVLIYLAFTVSNPLAPIVITRIGAKRSMCLSVVFYALYPSLVPSGSTALICFGSILVGVAAGVLWTAQSSYLIRASDEQDYGKNSGFFTTVFMCGGGIGVFCLGWILKPVGFQQSFSICAVIALLSIIPLLMIADLRAPVQARKSFLQQVKAIIKSKTLLRLSPLWFSFNLIFGLLLGRFPLEIKQAINLQAVAMLIGIFYCMSLLSLVGGAWSDRVGRKWMLIITNSLRLLGLAILMIQPDHPILLSVGILVLAVDLSVARPLANALIGDISADEYKETISGLAWMAQTLGMSVAFMLSVWLDARLLYAIILISIVVSGIFPLRLLLRQSFDEIKLQIAEELSE